MDEAQNLSPRTVEELRMLSNFQTDDRPLLQTFLLGQPEFRETLLSRDMQQLRQRVIATYHLGPMDLAETQSYIEHRLTTAGWQGNPAFDEDAFAAIHNYTAGIPRKINNLCDRLLLMGYLEKLHAFGGPEVNEVICDIQQEFDVPATAACLSGESRGAPIPESGESLLNMEDMDNRLARLEESVVSLLELLKQLLSFRTQAKKLRRIRFDVVYAQDAPAPMIRRPIRNAMTIDVEDYFQVSAFAPYIARETWESIPCRVEFNVDRILTLLDEEDTKATFFTLGWIATAIRRWSIASFQMATSLQVMDGAIIVFPIKIRMNFGKILSEVKPFWKISVARRCWATVHPVFP